MPPRNTAEERIYRVEHIEEIRRNARKHYNKHKEQKRWYLRRYGITLEQIDEILLQQDHKCALCGKSLREGKRCVDHDHITRKVRGILCQPCNIKLSYFEFIYTNEKLLRKTIQYLNMEESLC